MRISETLRAEYGRVPSDPIEAAAWWHEALAQSGGDPRVDYAHRAWLDDDPTHAQAWQLMESAWFQAGEAAQAPYVIASRAAAAPYVPTTRPNSRATLALGAACLVLAVVSVWQLPVFDRSRPVPSLVDGVAQGTFHTAVGQRSQVVLEDGSVVHLNTATRLAVQIDQAHRRVTLIEGQALFRIAHDPKRPFEVSVGERRITALGTSFDIRVDVASERMQVTMVEGRARIDWTDSQIELGAGEQWMVSRSTQRHRQQVEAERVISWRDGRLIFDDTSLREAVEEVNRYTSRPIVLQDVDLGALRISGVFSTGRGELFAEAIQALHELKIDLRNPEYILVSIQ